MNGFIEAYSLEPYFFFSAVVGGVLFFTRFSVSAIHAISYGKSKKKPPISLLSIDCVLAFVTGQGWMGMVALKEWKISEGMALGIGLGSGILFSLFVGLLLRHLEMTSLVPQKKRRRP